MPWLRHFALFLVFVTALFRPAAAGAFVSAPDAGSQARVGALEFVAATLVGPASGVTCGLHEGIGAAYDENASGYRFAAGGGARPFAIGLTDEGLEAFVNARGATTWRQLPDVANWRSGVLDKLADPNTMVHFNLDGVDVWQGVSRAAAGSCRRRRSRGSRP